LLVTGYTYERGDERIVAAAPGLGEEQAQNIAIYDVAGAKPMMLAVVESFSEHAENNLASAATSDGVVHLIATEVLVGRGNTSRVHHLRFDPRRREWIGDDVLFVRSEFTSTNTPRVVAAGTTVDAFWLPEGGQDQLKSDGLYAHRIGEPTTWRLTDRRGEYAILPNADGRGALLVGVAMNPSREGRVRWFLRRGGTWSSAGESDFGMKLYTLNTTGTEPFALWRDRSGSIRAAFLASGKLVIAELKLPE